MSALPRADLAAMLDRAWRLLEDGAASRHAPFHLVQVATLGPEGPEARTVVLRGADRAAGTLRFHTDARAPKAAEIAADPRVALVGYDPGLGLQLRMRGRAALHAGAAAWAASGRSSRVCYRAAFAPSSPVAAPEAADPTPAMRDPADPDEGRANFRAVLVTLGSIDWLDLASEGHRRARFAAPDWQGAWLAP